MGILDRMSRIIRSNINDLLDDAEDPEKMLNELMREMQSNIREARTQVAAMIAQEKQIENELRDARNDAAEWERKAELALERDREELAREALRRKRDAESNATVYEHQLTTQQEAVSKLKTQLRLLENKYQEAESKRDMLIARHKRTQAQRKITKTFSTLPDLSTTGELDRMEKRIKTEEAQAAAMHELETDTVEWQFAELDADDDVDEELAALKARVSGENPKSLSQGSTGKSE